PGGGPSLPDGHESLHADDAGGNETGRIPATYSGRAVPRTGQRRRGMVEALSSVATAAIDHRMARRRGYRAVVQLIGRGDLPQPHGNRFATRLDSCKKKDLERSALGFGRAPRG